MSSLVERVETAWRAVDALEDDAMDVARWGAVLSQIGRAEGDIPSDLCEVIGRTLESLGNRLGVNYQEAHRLVADVRKEVRPCA